MNKFLGLSIVLSIIFIATPAMADVYKCTSAAGEVVFQGEPCRKGDEVKLDIRFAENAKGAVDNLISGSWCEVGTSNVADGLVQQDTALRKTWIFSDRQMVQHITQGQRLDTFKYQIRQSPGSFVIDHPAFGSGQVSWQVKKLTDDKLVIAAYGGFTHLTAGNCEIAMASTAN